MNTKNWIDIVQLSEFIKYSTTEQLIELSICSKLFRFKLVPYIFKTLKFNYSKVNKFGYGNCLITDKDSEYNEKYIEERIQHYRRENYYNEDEKFDYQINILTNPYKSLNKKLIASRQKFQSDLKLVPYKPLILFIDNIGYRCYLIREPYILFNSLKALYINDINVAIEDLKYFIYNLKCLEDLKFASNSIFKCKLETIDSHINWPQTSKKTNYWG
jgi:hypothetical protein